MDNRNFKENVKTAAVYLAEHGVEVSHTRLLEAFSRAFGKRNWSTLSAQLKPGSKSNCVVEWDPTMGPMSEAVYSAHGGNRCPFCGGTNLDAEEVQADGPHAWGETTCNDCNSTWNSDYSLTGYSNAVAGSGGLETASASSAAVEGLLSTLTHLDVIVLAGKGYDMQDFSVSGVYPAREALAVLAKSLPDNAARLLSTASALFGAVAEDESEAIKVLREAGVRMLRTFTKQDVQTARNEANLACAGRTILQRLREDVVEDLANDVRDRARRHGFSYSGYATARQLARVSAKVLLINASELELTQVASRIG